MQGYNLVVVFSPLGDKMLMCRRIKDPYNGLMNFVGGKIENGESGEDAAYRELFEEIGTRNVQLFPGIAEALRRHTEAGHLQAIATSRGHLSVEQLCEKLGIRHHFHYIVACEDVACHKPDPTPVLVLARMAGVSPADVEVIGDTTFDIEMGRRARAGACTGVAWGNHSPQRLLTAGADFVAEKAESL